MKKQVLKISLFAMVSMLPLTAAAADGAPASSGSDLILGPEMEMPKITLPALKVTPGKIDVKALKAEARGGMTTNSQGTVGGGAEVNVRGILPWKANTTKNTWDFHDHGTAQSLTFAPLDLEVNARHSSVGSGRVLRAELDVNAISIARLQSIEFHNQAITREEVQELIQEEAEAFAEYQEEHEAYYVKDDFKRRKSFEAAQERLVQVRKRMRDQGARFEHVNDSSKGYSVRKSDPTTSERNREVHFTMDLNFGRMGYLIQESPLVNGRRQGFKVDIADFNMHRADRIEGVNVDLCGGVKMQLVVPHSAPLQNRNVGSVQGNLCAGVQLGQFGNLRDHVTGTADFGSTYLNLRNTVGIDKIGGSPIGLHHLYEIEKTNSGEVHTQGGFVQALF